jgi:hypothetical protein
MAFLETYSTSSSAWTLVMPWTRAIPSLYTNPSAKSSFLSDNHSIDAIAASSALILPSIGCIGDGSIPNRQDTTSLGKAGLFLDATDPLLEDRGDLGRGSLCLSSIGSDLF